MATLLPPAVTQFFDANGVPLDGGSVYFYVPNTTTAKNTWSDSGQTTLNPNPIILNAAGENPAGGIFGSGIYRQVIYDSAGNLIWDQITSSTDAGGVSWGGTSGGSGNAQTITAGDFSSLDGQQIGFIAGFSNSGPMTLTVSGGSPIPVLLDTASGPSALGGGEVVAANEINVVYDATRGAFHLTNPTYGVISGGTISNTTIILKQSAAPAPTAEGDIRWNTAADQIAIGDGAATQTFTNDAARASRQLSPNGVAFTTSINAGALTINLVGANGSAPSATNPVNVPFRSSTTGTGTVTVLTVTAATSLAISSGSTLGFSSGVAGRFWVVGFNDAGTFRLGVINCLSGTSVYPLRDGIYSSTAEGGAGGADSAQVFYTGTAVSSKAAAVLCYMEWASGLTAAGTWDALPTIIQIFEPGVSLPGTQVQVQRNDTGAVATGTTTIPHDDTIPQSGEGVQFMTQAITPTAAANLLRVRSTTNLASSASGTPNLIAALFRDSTASALTCDKVVSEATNAMYPVPLDWPAVAGATASTTFKIRGGSNSAGTTTFNGESGSRLFGGAVNSYLEASEIMA